MSTVAVAGGGGNIGRTLVDAIKASPQYNAIILARKPAAVEDPDAPTFVVDYEDVESLADVLAKNNVQIVISALSVFMPQGGAAEIGLVKAAAKSGTVKRFVPSEWSIPIPDDSSEQMFQKPSHEATMAELRKTDLEWTRFHIGVLMEYWAPPSFKTHMPRMNFYINIARKVAGLPGDGSGVMSFTCSTDVAAMVVRHLSEPKWEESTFAFTEEIALIDLVKMAEEILGQKFDVTYDSWEKLQEGEFTNISDYPIPPHLKPLMIKYSKWIIEGHGRLPMEKSIRNKYPDIPYLTLRDTVSMWLKE